MLKPDPPCLRYVSGSFRAEAWSPLRESGSSALIFLSKQGSLLDRVSLKEFADVLRCAAATSGRVRLEPLALITYGSSAIPPRAVLCVGGFGAGVDFSFWLGSEDPEFPTDFCSMEGLIVGIDPARGSAVGWGSLSLRDPRFVILKGSSGIFNVRLGAVLGAVDRAGLTTLDALRL